MQCPPTLALARSLFLDSLSLFSLKKFLYYYTTSTTTITTTTNACTILLLKNFRLTSLQLPDSFLSAPPLLPLQPKPRVKEKARGSRGGQTAL